MIEALEEMKRTYEQMKGLPWEEIAKALYCQALRALEKLKEEQP